MNAFDVLVQAMGLLLVCSLYLLHVRTLQPRPSRRAIVGRLAGVGLVWLLCAAVFLAIISPGSASAITMQDTSVEVGPAPRACADSCGVKSWSRKGVKRMKAGKIVDAKGYEFPRAIKKKLNRAFARQFGRAALRSDDHHWWQLPLAGLTCLANPMDPRRCGPYDENLEEVIKEDTVDLAFDCGGQAVIGFLGAKVASGKFGWWGAGIGTLQCSWSKFWNGYKSAKDAEPQPWS